MTDYFALMSRPRRPWLDADALKQQFLELSAGVHPDRVHPLSAATHAAAHEQYVQLNAAYQCLREPRDRLRCLLELERGTPPRPVERIPTDLMELSLETGRVCREADALLRERQANESPLLKVQLFQRSQAQIEILQGQHRKIHARRETAMRALEQLDAEWDSDLSSGDPDGDVRLNRVEELYRLFSYFDRWLKQIQERIVGLSV